MRAVRVEQPGLAVRITKGDEVLTEDTHPNGWRIRTAQFRSECYRRPKAPEEVPHRRRGADVHEQLVVFLTKHRRRSAFDASARFRVLHRMTAGLPCTL